MNLNPEFGVQAMYRLVSSFGLLLMLSLAAVLPAVHAQSPDSEPPLIDYEPVPEGLAGESQLFSVTVTDNQDLASVTFNYRLGADADYIEMPMQRQGNTDTYMVTLFESELGTDTQEIQHFIVAVDAAGNRTLEGFAFSPLSRELKSVTDITPEIAQEETGALDRFANLPTSRKILYGALGVLVVGALISASDSGGTSVSGTNVTVVVEPLPTN